MMSIYSGVCRIYTPRHSVHLRYTCISVQPPSLLEDVLARACLRCTWRRSSSELRDALGGRDWASLEMNLQAVIGRVRRCTWRPWLSEIGRVLGASRWTARRESIHQLVNSQPWECDNVTSPLSPHGELADGGRSCRRHAGSWSYIERSTCHHENEGKTNNLRWMLYSVLTYEHGMER